MAILALTAPLAQGQSVVGTITTSGLIPKSVAVHEGSNRVFIADDATGQLLIYDGTTLAPLGSIAVGTLVWDMVVDEPSGKLYAGCAPQGNNGPRRVCVVDAVGGRLLRQLSGNSPGDYSNLFERHMAVDSELGKVYVLHLGGLTQIDIATDTETKIPGFGQGGFEGLGLNPITHEVFVSRYIQRVMVIINGRTLSQTSVPDLGAANQVGVNWTENKQYIAFGGGVGVPFRVYDRDTGTTVNVPADNDALWWTYNWVSNRMYSDSEVNRIATVIEGATDAFANVAVANPATALAVRYATNRVYYAGCTYVGVLDDSTRQYQMLPVSSGSCPAGVLGQCIAVNQTTGRLFVITDNRRNFVTVVQDPVRAAAAGSPTVSAPAAGHVSGVSGVTFSWAAAAGDGYALRVRKSWTGEIVFSGSLAGSQSTSTLIGLRNGSYLFEVQGCSGGFAPSNCGPTATSPFAVGLVAPTDAPNVTSPTVGAALMSSTQTLSWSAVTPNPALSGMTYEVVLRDLQRNLTALQINVPHPQTSTIFSLRSSTSYELKVRACQAACGPFSPAVTFSVTLPGVPASAPGGITTSISGSDLTLSWNPVSGADLYQIQIIQPGAGPGGGALTVAARQVSATSVTLPVPAGAANVLLAACNGDGCGSFSPATAINPSGSNPATPNLGTPMSGTVVSGPIVNFSWNRIPGDSGSSVVYRLFVQDLSRQATALDVYTRDNFYAAYFKAEGARYDGVVLANPGTGQQVGPAVGFNVSGASATAPTMVQPAHQGTTPLLIGNVPQGNIQLGWSPVSGATLYEYFVAVQGQGQPTVRGVTPGLFVQVPLPTAAGQNTVYSGIVRACPAAATCAAGSDAGWGPWSNQGGPGVTNFTVTP